MLTTACRDAIYNSSNSVYVCSKAGGGCHDILITGTDPINLSKDAPRQSNEIEKKEIVDNKKKED